MIGRNSFAALGVLAAGGAVAVSAFFVEPDVEVLYTIGADQPGSSFGWVAEDLGDIDGDGASDFVVSAPFLVDGNGNSTGRVSVHSGADGALLASHDGEPAELLGFSASLAGDLNGDGVNDYAAGSLGRVLAWSGADHSLLWVQTRVGENFGFDLDTAGDIDGDGLSEVVAGATAANGFTGKTYLLSGADGSVVWERDGTRAFEVMGSAVGRLGDVNGDGVRDVVAGARLGGPKSRGIAYALSGLDGSILYDMRPVGLPATPFSTFATFHAAGGGDVDGDGIGDIFIGDFAARRGPPNSATGRAYVFSGADGSRLWVFDAENNGDGIGPGRLTGDVDGDGAADVYLAAFTFGANAEGKGYLYSGADGALLRTMTGTAPGALLGVDALALTDLNGDGLQDYLLTGNDIVHVIAGN